MLNRDCNQFTTGLRKIQEEEREFADLLAGDFVDTAQIDEKLANVESVADELFLDEVTEVEQIAFDETELARRFSFLFRDSAGHNSFAFSPDGEICAIQKNHFWIDFYDKDGNKITTNTVTTDSMIHSFYFLNDKEFVYNYFYDSQQDGPSRGTYYSIIDGSQSRLKTFEQGTKGQIYAYDKYGRKITWEPGKTIWGEANGGGYSLPGSEQIERLEYMKSIGDFLICQTDLELLCFRIDNGTIGLTYKYDTFASASFGNQLLFVDEKDDWLKILNLDSGEEERICRDNHGWFRWQKTFDKGRKNIFSVDETGLVRVFNLKKKKIISAFKTLDGEQFFPSQIGYTADNKIIVSGGHNQRATKTYKLPGLDKYQSNQT